MYNAKAIVVMKRKTISDTVRSMERKMKTIMDTVRSMKRKKKTMSDTVRSMKRKRKTMSDTVQCMRNMVKTVGSEHLSRCIAHAYQILWTFINDPTYVL